MNLEVGTAETIADDKKLKPRSLVTAEGTKGSGKSRGGGGGGNDGGSGGGSGNNNPNNRNLEHAEEPFKPEKLRMVTWFLLLVVLMTFGALIATYLVISTNGVAEWQPFNLRAPVFVSTALILLGSLTYQIADRKLQAGAQQDSKNWLIATTALGATFISSQILAWLDLANRGFYLRGNPYVGLFYVLTAVHALHVLGGILALGYMLLRNWRETSSNEELLRRRTLSKVVGWYWHFMGALWIVLFLLLGYWK